MTLQTSVTFQPPVALPGDVRGQEYASQTRMAAVVMQGGLFACQGTRDETCKLPTSAADVAKGLGISRSWVARDQFGVAVPGYTYQVGDSVDLVHRGQIWVTVEQAVSPMDPVYARHAAYGTNTQLGGFRKDADTHSYVDYATLVTGARYLTTAAEGGLALVDLNLPQ